MSNTLHHRPSSEGDWHPEYGGIDWRRRQALEMAKVGMEDMVELWMVFTDGYDQQVTQENCRIQVNLFVDEMDSILAQDERDGSWQVWWRDKTNNFDEMLETLGPFCLWITTRYPEQDVVERYLTRNAADLAEIDNWSQDDGKPSI